MILSFCSFFILKKTQIFLPQSLTTLTSKKKKKKEHLEPAM